MQANEYQELALRTANLDQNDFNTRLSNWGLGLAGEAGETADCIKKVIHHEHELNADKIASEAADCLWYIAVLGKELGFTLSEMMEMNINKLKKRYPNGFNKEDSINR